MQACDWGVLPQCSRVRTMALLVARNPGAIRPIPHRFPHQTWINSCVTSLSNVTFFREAVMVRRAFDLLFVLTLIVPPATVLVSALLLALLTRVQPSGRTIQTAVHA